MFIEHVAVFNIHFVSANTSNRVQISIVQTYAKTERYAYNSIVCFEAAFFDYPVKQNENA